MENKRGRPRIDNRREHNVHIRMNDEELRAYRHVGAAGVRDYLRSLSICGVEDLLL